MKKTILLLAMTSAFLSCKKETVKPINTAKVSLSVAPKTESISYLIDPGIVSSSITNGVQKVVYTGGMNATITPDLLDVSKVNIELSFKGNIVRLTGKTSIDKGLQKIQFFANGIEYFSDKINSQGMIGETVFNQSINPYLVFVPSDKKDSYITCMQGFVHQCGLTWTCTIICGAGLWSCQLGWSLECWRRFWTPKK